MKTRSITPVDVFEEYLPEEYRDLVEHGPYNTNKLEKAVQRAILISRAVGPTYVQIYTPCPTNMKFSSNETINVAREAEKDYYSFDEYFSREAENYLHREL